MGITFLFILVGIVLWNIKITNYYSKRRNTRLSIFKKPKNSKAKKKVNETTVSSIIPQLYILMEEEELYKNPLLINIL
jgi:hypothetical protein